MKMEPCFVYFTIFFITLIILGAIWAPIFKTPKYGYTVANVGLNQPLPF